MSYQMSDLLVFLNAVPALDTEEYIFPDGTRILIGEFKGCKNPDEIIDVLKRYGIKDSVIQMFFDLTTMRTEVKRYKDKYDHLVAKRYKEEEEKVVALEPINWTFWIKRLWLIGIVILALVLSYVFRET